MGIFHNIFKVLFPLEDKKKTVKQKQQYTPTGRAIVNKNPDEK
jgi:hypothetical protein